MAAPAPVTTVTPNPAVDETYRLNGFHPGQTHRVHAPQRRAGGKGLNVARVLHQIGYSSWVIAPVGGPSGDEFRDDLAASGMDSTLIPVAAATRRSIALVDDANGVTSILNEYGEPLTTAEWGQLRAAVQDRLPHAGALVGSGSLPQKSPSDFYPWLVRIARAEGIPVIIDTSGPALVDAAAAGADVLKPNHHELLEATGAPTIDTGALELIRLGAKLIVVSAGADGIMAFSAAEPDVAVTARLPRTLQGNPTGAGDAAVAAIAQTLAERNSNVETLLRRATAWSAAAVLMPVAGEIHRSYAELEKQIIVRRRSLGQA